MDAVKIVVHNEEGVKINNRMIGLFFEDINYAADGGLYGEMLENRSFEFLKAAGDAKDYYIEYDGGYAWSAYPDTAFVTAKPVLGSPHSEENPHYMRVTTSKPFSGIQNKGYDGLFIKKDMKYHVTFWARCVKFNGNFVALLVKDGKEYAKGLVSSASGTNQTYNYFAQYEVTITADAEIEGAEFVIGMDRAGIVEFDFVSMMPEDAVAGIFRKDLFDKLNQLKPGFIRFPGGCIVEGNTYDNRYKYKDSLKPVWARKNNWNRWAVHETKASNGYESPYCHYNQTLGLGYYEYFLLCDLIGCEPLPVANVGFACQYQSTEIVSMESDAFRQCVQDTLDLIEFANGDTNTRWGRVRAEMGHEAPFNLKMIGIGNEQWETKDANFFDRYTYFEKAIHEKYPAIQLIGSAGPDITSEHYTDAWKFYHDNQDKVNFVYAVDEHYYVKPQWLYDHTNFYDQYDRKVKVFSGEYAAHPCNGMNMPQANTLGGALAEAAFLTGVERNADVVVLASYAPLFARIGYAQWSPDMIWFNAKENYETPSYWVQRMYSENMGTSTLITNGQEKELSKKNIYYSISYDEHSKDTIVKIVNGSNQDRQVQFDFKEQSSNKSSYQGTILTGFGEDARNSMDNTCLVHPTAISGMVANGVELPAWSFTIIRF